MFGVRLDPRDATSVTYIAIWAQGGFKESAGYQEMAVIPPQFDPQNPLPMIGAWKALDPTLKSIGHTTGFMVN